MKKLIVLALSIMSCFSAFAGSQGEDNGFGIKLFAGFHGDKYAFPDIDILGFGFVDAEYPYEDATPSFGLALDSRWYVANPGKFGIGINARWLDFGFASCSVEEDETYDSYYSKSIEYSYESKNLFFDFSLLGVGPIGTFYLGDDMAIDAYYNFMPNVFVNCAKPLEYSSDDKNFSKYYKDIVGNVDDENEYDFAFGISHRLGAAFRYKVFQLGFEAKFGNLKSQDWGNNEEDEVDEMFGFLSSDKIRTGNFRLFLGFKF